MNTKLRNLTIVFIILSFFACNQKNKKSDNLIEQFEKVLNEKETNYLNEIANDLDNYLATKYPEQESKFKAYLVDISELRIDKYWKIDSVKLKKYRESNLFGRYDTIFPDSVWFDGSSFKIRFPDFDLIEEMISNQRKNEEINIDSTINFLKNKPKFLLSEKSNYFIALESIQKSDSLISNYFKAKEVAGNLTPPILARGLLNNYNSNDDYFAKRIFIIELFE